MMNNNIEEEVIGGDEYHSIQELYNFRLMYNSLLFNAWYEYDEVEVYKSKKHNDGTIPFEDDDEDWWRFAHRAARYASRNKPSKSATRSPRR